MTPLTARAKFVMTRNLFFRACPLWDERAPTSEARREASPQLQRFPRLAQETEQRAETSPEGLGQFNSSFQLSIR